MVVACLTTKIKLLIIALKIINREFYNRLYPYENTFTYSPFIMQPALA